MDNSFEPVNITLEKPVYDRFDAVMAIVLFAFGFLFCHMGLSLALGTFAFAVALFAVSAVYLTKRGHRLHGSSFIYLIIGLISSAYFLVGANQLLSDLNFLFIIGVYVLWVAAVCKTDTKLFPFDCLNQFFPVAFGNFSTAFSSQSAFKSGKKRGRTLLYIFIGIIISVFLLLFIIPLLVVADAAFEALMDNITIELSSTSFEIIAQLIFGVPIGAYIFAILYGNAHARHTSHINADRLSRASASARTMPCAMVFTVLSVICAVYILFFISQTSYFLSAFESIRPENYTFAEYARRGFFELCAIAFINLCIILFSRLLAKRDENSAQNKALTVFSCIFSVFTLFFIAIALSKMIMYIQAYGLTQLRVYTSLLMITLAVVFILMIIRQFKKFNITKTVFIVFSAVFLILCWSNCDSLIARYNINAYESGKIEALDIEALCVLSPDAYPAIVDYYESYVAENGDDNFSEELRTSLYFSCYIRNQNDLRNFNINSKAARSAVDRIENFNTPYKFIPERTIISVDDLLARYDFIGMHYSKVEEIIGKPDERSGQFVHYYTKDEISGISVLSFELDGFDNVVQVYGTLEDEKFPLE